MAESFLQRQERTYGGGGYTSGRTRGDYGGFIGGSGGFNPVRWGGGAPKLPQNRWRTTQTGQEQADRGATAQPQTTASPQTAAGGANQPQTAAGGQQTAAGAAGAAPTSYNLNQFQTWAQQRYGQQADQNALNRISGRVGAAGADGYSAEQYRLAQQEADAIARERGWQGPAMEQAPAEGNQPAQPQPGEVGHQGRVAVEPADYERADTGNVSSQANALMERILANPESLPPEVVAQMKARAKESGLSMMEQLRGQAATNLAGRGFSAAGGQQAGADAAVNSELINNLINSNRDIDINAAGQNFNDRLSALQAGSGYMNDAESRAGMRDDRRFRNEEFRYGQMRDDRQGNLQEFLGREGVNMDRDRFNETRRQFNQTFGFDILRFLEDTRRDNRNFGEGQRQHNNTTGLGYSQLNQQGQNSLMNWLAQTYGG